MAAHNKALTLRPKNIADYTASMRGFGIEVLPKFASNGKLVGTSFQLEGSTIKASSVHRSLSAANLQQLFDKNNYSFKLRL